MATRSLGLNRAPRIEESFAQMLGQLGGAGIQRHFRGKQTRDALRAAGFTDEEIEQIGPLDSTIVRELIKARTKQREASQRQQQQQMAHEAYARAMGLTPPSMDAGMPVDSPMQLLQPAAPAEQPPITPEMLQDPLSAVPTQLFQQAPGFAEQQLTPFRETIDLLGPEQRQFLAQPDEGMADPEIIQDRITDEVVMPGGQARERSIQMPTITPEEARIMDTRQLEQIAHMREEQRKEMAVERRHQEKMDERTRRYDSDNQRYILKNYIEPLSKHKERAQKDIRDFETVERYLNDEKLWTGPQRVILEKLGLDELITNPETAHAKSIIDGYATGAASAYNTSNLTNLEVETYKNSFINLRNPNDKIRLQLKNLKLEGQAIELKDKISMNIMAKNPKISPIEFVLEFEKRVKEPLKKFTYKALDNVDKMLRKQGDQFFPKGMNEKKRRLAVESLTQLPNDVYADGQDVREGDFVENDGFVFQRVRDGWKIIE